MLPDLPRKPNLLTIPPVRIAGPTPALPVRTHVAKEVTMGNSGHSDMSGQGSADKSDVVSRGSLGHKGVTPFGKRYLQEAMKSPGYSDYVSSNQRGILGVGATSVSGSGHPVEASLGSAVRSRVAMPGQAGVGSSGGYSQTGHRISGGDGQLGPGSLRGCGQSESSRDLGQSGAWLVRGPTGPRSSCGCGLSQTGSLNGQSGPGLRGGYSQTGTRPSDGDDQLGTGSSGGYGQFRAVSMSGQTGKSSANGYGQTGPSHLVAKVSLEQVIWRHGSSGGLGQPGAGSMSGATGPRSSSGYGLSRAGLLSGPFEAGLSFGYGHSGTRSHNDYGKSEAGSSLGHGHSDVTFLTPRVPWRSIIWRPWPHEKHSGWQGSPT